MTADADLGYYGDDMIAVDMGERVRRVHEQMKQSKQDNLSHLFAQQRDRLEAEIRDLEAKNWDLLIQLREAERNVMRLESVIDKKERRASSRGVKKGQRNRVVFHVTATMEDQPSACLLGQTLADTRGPESGKSMLVTDWGVNGSTLGFIVDYTVVGGHPADIWRDDPSPTRQGMLNRVATGLGVDVVSVDCKQHLRERVEEDQMPSEGS